jgi:hypothetical protein
MAAVGTDDVDALLGQVRVQLLDLLLRDLDLLQCGGDVVECQKAPLLPVRDKRPKLVQFVDRRLVRQQNLILDRTALPWMPIRALPPVPPAALLSAGTTS